MTDDSRCRTANVRHLLTVLDTLDSLFIQGATEYELITLLQKPPFELFDETALREPLALFQCHFILFHALYLLQEQWQRQHKGWLTIHTTSIRLTPMPQASISLATDPMRDYYLNWSHFDRTGEADVEVLIKNFWRRMKVGANVSYSDAAITEARQLLNFAPDEPLTRMTIKKHYHQMQHRHHPDKGGDAELAGRLAWACEVLLASA